LQATLMQLEADLRRLTFTVQALAESLAQFEEATQVIAPADGVAPPQPDPAPTHEPPAVSRWRLREGGWTLVSPQGQRLALTTLERKFISALFAAPSRSLARGDLSALAPSGGESGDHPASSPRGVDVMVSRLRRKAQAMGMPLPLRSVRRWGYMFTEQAEAE
jgi:DNA-binding response OmpR family regulator